MGRMITQVSLTTIYCLDQQETHDFYIGVLGFKPHSDVSPGEGFRWLTVSPPDQPEVQLVLAKPGPPLDEEEAAFIRRQLGKGHMGGLGLRVDDCKKTCAELVAKGVALVQEPADRPYGVEAVIRDNSGNWLVLIEPREYSPESFA